MIIWSTCFREQPVMTASWCAFVAHALYGKCRESWTKWEYLKLRSVWIQGTDAYSKSYLVFSLLLLSYWQLLICDSNNVYDLYLVIILVLYGKKIFLQMICRHFLFQKRELKQRCIWLELYSFMIWWMVNTNDIYNIHKCYYMYIV